MKSIKTIIILIAISLLPGCAVLGFDSAVYGCWCGKGEPPEGENPNPIDMWDAACMRHDLCYRDWGMDNPQCDINFINELRYIRATHHFERVPSQMQVAHDFFFSRLTGYYQINAVVFPQDLIDYWNAGCSC